MSPKYKIQQKRKSNLSMRTYQEKLLNDMLEKRQELVIPPYKYG